MRTLLLGVAILGTLGCVDEQLATATRGVIGGTVTQAGMYPATGALIAEVQGRRIFFCTGTLIAPDAVATAAHCLFPPPQVGDFMPSFTLALDANNVTPGQLYRGRAKYAHPQFDNNRPAPGTLAQTYDVGIVLLAQPVVGVAPAYLPTPEEAATMTVGMPLEITGYGQTNAANENSAGVKYHATTTLSQIGPYEIAVGTPGAAQNCMGDSGGPAYMRVGAGLRMVGIVSRGLAGGEETCDRGGIDTRTDAYRSWFAQYTKLADPPSDPAPPNDDTGPGSGSNGESDDTASPEDEMSGGCTTGRSSGGLVLAALIVCFAAARGKRRARSLAPCLALCLVGCATADGASNAPQGIVDCKASPSDPSCLGAACQAAPNSFECFCEQNPSDPHCAANSCTKNPSDPVCKGGGGDPCQVAPQSYECYCTQNPTAPGCQPNGDPCQVAPQSFECYCATYGQNDPACQGGGGGDPCQYDPYGFECYCATYGQNDPACQGGGGGGDPCQYDPYGFECYCSIYGQYDPACQGGGDPCQYDPYGFECYCSIYGQYDPACQGGGGGGDPCQYDPYGLECYCQYVPQDPYCW